MFREKQMTFAKRCAQFFMRTQEWEEKGKEVVAEMSAKYLPPLEEKREST